MTSFRFYEARSSVLVSQTVDRLSVHVKNSDGATACIWNFHRDTSPQNAQILVEDLTRSLGRMGLRRSVLSILLQIREKTARWDSFRQDNNLI